MKLVNINVEKKCHLCSKVLSRPFENNFSHCFECDLKRLEQLTPKNEPCKLCKKEKAIING